MTGAIIHRTFAMRFKPVRDMRVMASMVARIAPHHPIRRLLVHYPLQASASPTRQGAQRTRKQRLATHLAHRHRRVLRFARHRVRGLRNNLRVAFGTHDHSTIHSDFHAKPRNKTLRELLDVPHVLLIKREEQVLDLASLVEQLGAVQKIEVAALHSAIEAYY